MTRARRESVEHVPTIDVVLASDLDAAPPDDAASGDDDASAIDDADGVVGASGIHAEPRNAAAEEGDSSAAACLRDRARGARSTRIRTS